MKKVLSIVSFILIVGMLSSLIAIDVKSESNVYQFPLNTKSKEWKDMDHAEKAKVLNIPDEILENLSTDALLEVIVNYPLFIDILAYNTFDEGIKYVSMQFNGLEEFMSRQDLTQVLLDEYQKIDINYVKNIEETDNMGDFNKLLFVESMLFTEQVQKNMSEEQLIKLNLEILDKQQQIDNEGDSYGLLNQYKLMIEMNEVQGIELPSQQLELVERAKQFYNNSSIDPLVVNTSVLTPRGSLVPAIIYGELYTSDQKEQLKKQVYETYPGVNIISDATTNYNCHSYAWYQRLTSNNIWIPNPSKYLTDGSATRTYSVTANITRILYGYPDVRHSGICIEKKNNILSKWGALPLVEHTWKNCPYFLAPELPVYFDLNLLFSREDDSL